MQRTLPLLNLAAVIASAVAFAGQANAQANPWYIGAAQTLTHESNLYRLADGQTTPDGVSKSDLVSSTALLAGLDQTISRQRL